MVGARPRGRLPRHQAALPRARVAEHRARVVSGQPAALPERVRRVRGRRRRQLDRARPRRRRREALSRQSARRGGDVRDTRPDADRRDALRLRRRRRADGRGRSRSGCCRRTRSTRGSRPSTGSSSCGMRRPPGSALGVAVVVSIVFVSHGAGLRALPRACPRRGSRSCRPPPLPPRRDRAAGDLVGLSASPASSSSSGVPRPRDAPQRDARRQVVDSLATLFPATPGGAGTKQGLIVYLFRGRGDLAQPAARVQRRR